jgi:predicted hydrocarbon binding protein
MEGRPGEILVAGMRMCLLDAETSLYSLRKSSEDLIGQAVSTLFYNAGFHGGLKYAAAVIDRKLIREDAEGFRDAIREYSDGGFGDFEVRSLDFQRGDAVLSCGDPASVEAHAFLANAERRAYPSCDFSRGVLVGLLAGFAHLEGLEGMEETCRATGDESCIFRIGKEAVIRKLSVERSMARIPRKSPHQSTEASPVHL